MPTVQVITKETDGDGGKSDHNLWAFTRLDTLYGPNADCF
jgi:hypothetical protein